MRIGQPGFIPMLGMPNEELMKMPLFTDDSIMKELGGGGFGLADVFNQDVLEDAKNVIGVEFQYLYGNINFTIDVLVAVTADQPILPVGTKGAADDVSAVAMFITIEDINNPIPGVNAWFTTNMILSLTLNMMKMSDELKESALHEISATITAMTMVIEFAKSIADAIMKAAEKQSDMYKMQAFQAIMQAVVGALQVVSAAASMYGHSRETKWVSQREGDLPDGKIIGGRWEIPNGAGGGKGRHPISEFQRAGGVTSLAAVFNGLGAAINNFVSAALTLEKGAFEAYKAIQEVLKSLFENLMTSSLDSRKDLEEMLKKALNDLAQITSSSRKAANI